MCELVSATTGAITAAKVITSVIAVASGILGAYSTIQQGNSTKAINEYQAKVAEKNAKIADVNAAQERQSGLEEARRKRMITLQNIGSQQSAFAANNIDITDGTALDAIESTAQLGELDALTTEYNSARTAQNYNQQADNFRQQAYMDRIAGENASKNSKFSAAASGLGGLASGIDGLGNVNMKVSDKWKFWKNKNLFSGGLDSYKNMA